MTKTVVILGGAYAGVQIAHRLLKYTLPYVKDLKIILVSKDSHFYWNMASVRAIVPGIMKQEQYTAPLANGFAQYPATAFELIVGTAEAANTTDKTVKVTVGADGSKRELIYDYLVVATGTSTSTTGTVNMPWKNNGTHEELMALMTETQEKVRKAKHIVVAGAGPTAIETAAELAYEYGSPKDPADKKEIVLLTPAVGLLGGDSIASNVAHELGKFRISRYMPFRITGSRPTADGKTEIQYCGTNDEKPETMVTDLYLPALGLTPNTSFLPAGLLNADKFVDVDEFYRAKGAEDVWAAGDVVWKPRASFVVTDKQAAGVAKNIDAVLRGKSQTPVKTLPVDILMVTTGRERGAGRIGPIKAFSFMVYYIKGKTLGSDKLPAWVDGSAF
ncbi:hypothetical protein F4777DRAFT_372358 [Nemania sp. FL0916]|nr:hypothetical protein F4777DRAFT_372358 [Nemania sp. FL0916]